MGNRFASGKYAIAQCDRCDQRYKLKQLKELVIKTKNINMLVCPECWEPDQPQLLLGMYPVDDPQGLRNPRPDRSYVTSGASGLQLVNSTSTSPDAQGTLEAGSRIIQWGWAPVGGARADDTGLTPNDLISVGQTGTVTIELTPGPVPTVTVNGPVVIGGLSQAVINTDPGKTKFKTTMIGSRSLGDITNDGSVTSADSLAYLKWVNNISQPAAYNDYITNVMNPYMISNYTLYSAYLTLS
jgi:hypothetical protein